MNAQRLIQLFDRLCDAPDAIPRLRRFVLDLAVRGKLVAQDGDDEPVFMLPIKKTGLSVSKTLIQNTLDERSAESSEVKNVPFQIPDNWRWKSIGNCLELINGRAFKPTEWLLVGLPIVRIQNLNNKQAAFNYCDEKIVNSRHLIDTNTFLISWSGTPGTSFGAFIWENGKAALNQHIFKCQPREDIFYDKFLRIAINGRLDEMISNAHGGAGLQHITKIKLENLLLPVPPKNEQYRIVAKLDELTSILDDLEAKNTEREQKGDHVVVSALNHLTNGGGPEGFRDHANFYINHLPRLTTRPEHIQQLRQTILNLAVRGKLVPQDPNDEPASELIKKYTSRIGRNSENEKQVIELFPIPSTWKWIELATIAKILMGQSPPGESYNKSGEGIPLINGPVEFSNGPFGKTVVNQYTTNPTKVCEEGDLLLCVRGSTTGRTNLASFRACIGRGVAAIRPLIAREYIHFYIWKMRESIIRMGRGVAFPSVTREQIERLPLPLPPLKEQARIVDRVDELMSLTEKFSGHLNEREELGNHFLEAAIYSVVNT